MEKGLIRNNLCERERPTHLFFLNGLINKERGPERRLLRHLDIHCMGISGWANKTRTNLFRLDGVSELGRERDMCDRDVIKDDVES